MKNNEYFIKYRIRERTEVEKNKSFPGGFRFSSRPSYTQYNFILARTGKEAVERLKKDLPEEDLDYLIIERIDKILK